MQNDKIGEPNSLELIDKSITLSVESSIFASLEIKLPSAEELYQISKLSDQKISIKDVIIADESANSSAIKEQIEKLLLKEKKFSSSPTLHHHLAVLNEMIGNHEESFKNYRKASGQTNSAHFLLKELISLVNMKNPQVANQYLNDPRVASDTNILLFNALMLFREKKFSAAEEIVNKSLNSDKLNFRSRTLLGLIHLLTGRFETSILNLKIALEDNPNSSSIYRGIATAYLALKNINKAYANAKKAISINPIDESSLILFADLAPKANRLDEGISAIERFLKYEQTSVKAWERLARLLYLKNDFDSALKALRHQASLKETSSVLNNIGVVHLKLNDTENARKFLAYAMTIQGTNFDWIPAKNLIRNLTDSYEMDKAFLLFHSLPFQNVFSSIGKNRDLTDFLISGQISRNESEISSTKMKALDTYFPQKRKLSLKTKVKDVSDLMMLNQIEARGVVNSEISLVEVFEKALSIKDPDPNSYCDLCLYLTHHYSLVSPDREKLIVVCNSALDFLNANKNMDRDLRHTVFNNVIFSYLELDLVEEAEALVNKIASQIHKMPHPTATLGLLNLRKNRLEKGQELYEEAIRIEKSKFVKNRIRQKMLLEIARYHLRMDNKKLAKKFTEKALDIETATKIFNKQARDLLNLLKK